MKNVIYAVIFTGITAVSVYAGDEAQKQESWSVRTTVVSVYTKGPSVAPAGNDASNILQRLVMSITNTDQALHELGMITVTDTSAVASQAALKAIPPPSGIASVSSSTGR